MEGADLSKCPRCGGDADNGHDRCYPPIPYLCTVCAKSVGGSRMEVLQERVTLDEAALSAIRTFDNGCSYNLVFDGDAVRVELGCYGVHTYLVRGKDRLFLNWFGRDNDDNEPKSISLSTETICELKARKPCSQCGGFLFKSKRRQPNDRIQAADA